MGTNTNIQANIASAEKFLDWFVDTEGDESLKNQAKSTPVEKPKPKGQTLTFENVRIDFPLSPYPAQVQMMRNIIHTLNSSENALLESPTGSGKSLALLCAALAWRENEEKVVTEKVLQSINKRTIDKKNAITILDAQSPVSYIKLPSAIKQPSAIDQSSCVNQSTLVEQSTLLKQTLDLSEKSFTTQTSTKSEMTIESLSEDSNFQDYIPSKRQINNDNHPKNWKKKFRCDDDKVITIEDNSFEDFQIKAPTNDENRSPGLELKISPDDIDTLKNQASSKVPRIFVGSRTHKQITQLVRELKSKTRYKPRTTILGSREHLCIHPKVSKSNNKAEGCVELLDKNNCSFAHKTHKILKHSSLTQGNRIWDIEDMVNLGKKVRGCPYYASRKLYEGAEVVFCPYNYIIDPIIRKILDIDLKGSIVILDEAHNIEDSSRSAGSFEVDDQVLLIIRKELDYIVRNGIEVAAHETLGYVIDNLLTWITTDTNYAVKEYESHYSHWTGADIMRKLQNEDITAIIYETRLKPAYKAAAAYADLVRKETEDRGTRAVEEVDDGSSQVQIHYRKCLSNNSLTVIQGIFMVLGLLFEEEKNYAGDYQMVLSKRIERSNNPRPEEGRRRRKNKNGEYGPEWSYKLGFKCLNPGVIFKKMTEETRSVILTSGTLSPLNTFASELETKFEGRLEANHVIHKSQVWVGAIPRGPNRHQLRGIFSNMESFQYQDDIGESLCQIVESVPFGVLCFMPSYNALDKFIQRWKTTEMYDRLSAKKMIVTEPRGSDKIEFEKAIGKYYRQIDDVEIDTDEEDRDGALFFAVFRGKVSEGIDFSDNYCRAVVTIGIPYPGVKDMEVKFKKEYNDRKRLEKRNPDILTSNEWYSSQAFRAINQALGRCIRHKNDWGAIIMLEERFENEKIVQGLSKWVRNQFKIYPQFSYAISNLQDFVKVQVDRTSIKLPQIKAKVDSESSSPAGLDTPIAAEIDSPVSKPEVSPTNDLISAIEDQNDYIPLEVSMSANASVNFKESALDPPVFSLHQNNSVNSYQNMKSNFPRSNSESVSNANVKSPFFPPQATKVENSSVNDTWPTINLKANSLKHEHIKSEDPYGWDTKSEDLKLNYPTLPALKKEESLGYTDIDNERSYQLPNQAFRGAISRNDLKYISPFDTTGVRIDCTSCKEPLLYGTIGSLKPLEINDLALVTKSNYYKDKKLIEVIRPSSWRTAGALFGGPIDINLLPEESSGTFNKSDGVCYRHMGCMCTANTCIGIVICQASKESTIHYTGKVFIWLNRLTIEKEKEQAFQHYNAGQYETFSSQIPSVNDMFYSL